MHELRTVPNANDRSIDLLLVTQRHSISVLIEKILADIPTMIKYVYNYALIA